MRRYAVLTLTISAMFLLVVGAFLNTRALFYMSTVMIVTLISLRIQAWLATRGLRFERIAPTVIVAGERVTMRIRVWSTLKIRRPLLMIFDDLPASLLFDADIRPLPIAPTYEHAVETKYELKPLKRGVHRWSKIIVESTDSLGLVNVEKIYETEPIEVIIHPAKIPMALDMVSLSGWGASQSDEGRNRGEGLEPRGVREFRSGDSLRHVHWRTTARTGTMQVKEFETGYNTRLHIIPQLTAGTEAGRGERTTLEAMCGHAAFIADTMLQRGSSIELPNLEESGFIPATSAALRLRQICDALASAKADRKIPFASELAAIERSLPPGVTFIAMLSAAEPDVAAALRRISARARVLVLLYDPSSYAPAGEGSSLLPAVDQDFMAALAGPNTTVKIMPNPYGS